MQPAVAAQEAVRELVLPKPAIRTNPDEKRSQLVRVPTWMWLDAAMWKPVSKTVKVPGVTVTATAVPQRVRWGMGDGRTVVCEGAGTPYDAAKYSAEAASPDCGHLYRRSSAAEPGEAYQVSAAVIWDVTWHGGGEEGVVPGQETAAQVPLKVAEAQALVVP
ncbi:hypothetical protein DY218_18655 [Streptomyces triticagri]|uniref:ATP/GTP-binding protein n=1 Tax=Streptomyces triticagri TaxID=2293568 RepID=A0A372M3J1_9ACTN|nr:hypothetical protein DY218_18655 [Streptomyces triticagri]